MPFSDNLFKRVSSAFQLDSKINKVKEDIQISRNENKTSFSKIDSLINSNKAQFETLSASNKIASERVDTLATVVNANKINIQLLDCQTASNKAGIEVLQNILRKSKFDRASTIFGFTMQVGIALVIILKVGRDYCFDLNYYRDTMNCKTLSKQKKHYREAEMMLGPILNRRKQYDFQDGKSSGNSLKSPSRILSVLGLLHNSEKTNDIPSIVLDEIFSLEYYKFHYVKVVLTKDLLRRTAFRSWRQEDGISPYPDSQTYLEHKTIAKVSIYDYFFGSKRTKTCESVCSICKQGDEEKVHNEIIKGTLLRHREFLKCYIMGYLAEESFYLWFRSYLKYNNFLFTSIPE